MGRLADSSVGKILDSFSGNVDEDFWQRICTFQSYGSGGSKKLRGWSLVFSPFDEKGNYLLNSLQVVKETNIYADIDTDDICECSCRVPVEIDDNGDIFQSIFYAGQLMTCYENGELKPRSGYAVVVKKTIAYEEMKETVVKMIEEENLSNEKRYQEDLKRIEKEVDETRKERLSRHLKKRKVIDIEVCLQVLNYTFYLVKALEIPNDQWIRKAWDIRNYVCNTKDYSLEAYCKSYDMKDYFEGKDMKKKNYGRI